MLSNSTRSEQRRPQTDKQQPSRVLLVCVYDTIALQVNNQLIYQKFSKYGSIIKVLIFERGEVTKLFVQFTERSHAEQAKANLDGTKLLGAICKMNIYFSNFSNVDLKNETTEGADFTMQQEMKNQYVRQFDHLARSFQGEQNYALYDDYLMESAFSQFVPRSKTDNPRRLQEEISMVNARTHLQNHGMINEEEEFDHMINHGINNLLETQSNHSHENKPYFSTQSSHSSVERINPSLRLKDSSQSKSSVFGFDLHRDISIKCIYNLFSNFGNISFISKKNKKAFIKFRTVQFAAIASTYLNEYFLMGNLLRLDPISAQDALPKQSEYCECIFYDESFDRFTPTRSLTVNSPSQTLHVSSLKKDICRENALYKIFSDYGKVEAVKILCYSNQKNMALVKFYSMQDSFEAIANLHNQVFSGRKMQISFTKSRV